MSGTAALFSMDTLQKLISTEVTTAHSSTKRQVGPLCPMYTTTGASVGLLESCAVRRCFYSLKATVPTHSDDCLTNTKTNKLMLNK